MAQWKNACVGLALSLILLGVCCDASDEGVAGEESKANQGVFYQQGPPLQQFPPRPPPNWIPFYPPPRPPPRQFPRPPPRRPPAPPRRAAPFDIASFITYYYLIRAFIATPAPPTTTPALKIVPVCTGSWGAWGACSANCAGTQSRKHPCTGAMEYRPCNGPGFTPSGWYRAINCYEYFVSANAISQPNAKLACEAQGAKLIHVGLRNSSVTADVMENLVQFSTSPEIVYIGLEFINSDWQWEDGDTTEPMIWASSTTPSGTSTCAFMELGNPRSGAQSACTSNRNYICERKVA